MGPLEMGLLSDVEDCKDVRLLQDVGRVWPDEEDGSAGGEDDGEQDDGDEMEEPLEEIPEDRVVSFLFWPLVIDGVEVDDEVEEETAASKGWSGIGC